MLLLQLYCDGMGWDIWLFYLAWSLLFMRREPFRSLFTHTRMRWYEMKGQPNRDSNLAPLSQGATTLLTELTRLALCFAIWDMHFKHTFCKSKVGANDSRMSEKANRWKYTNCKLPMYLHKIDSVQEHYYRCNNYVARFKTSQKKTLTSQLSGPLIHSNWLNLFKISSMMSQF